MWLGEDSIEGKTVLIHADEGLGRYHSVRALCADVAARGARVILVVAQAVHSLLSAATGRLAMPAIARPARCRAFDLHCPMSSLPLAFETRLDTIPSRDILSAALPRRPRRRPGKIASAAHDKLRVGLVWSGNPGAQQRSQPLDPAANAVTHSRRRCDLRQPAEGSDGRTTRPILRERPDIIDLTADLADFSETAALVSCLDLVITVDTSVAHLAAALGRPTWILLPYTPDYRWLLDRDDSPWYPTARLFRQSESRDYGEVLDRVRDELAALVAARPD